MRNSQVVYKKTICIADVIKQAKDNLKTKSPIETYNIIKDKYFESAGVRVIFDNTEIPKLIYNTDNEAENKNEKTEQITPTRMLLTCDRASRNHQIELASECNGIVIDFATWNILSYPPAALSFNMPKNTIIDCFLNGHYKIIYADYGTVVTLYHYGGKWIMSTSNSYEIDNLKWMGQFTFRELLDEILADEKIDIETLDTDYCYSIGFHHNEYHKFNVPGRKMRYAWFIRAVNLKKYNNSNIVKTNKEHLNFISEYVLETNSKLKLPMQTRNMELEKLIAIGGNITKEYDKMFEKCENALPNTINKQNMTPFFGYILKSNNPDIIADAFMESSLQTKLRLMVCQRPPQNINIENRFKWMVMNSMFNVELAPAFKRLFSESLPYIETYNNIINVLASNITRDLFKESVSKTSKFFIDELKYKNILLNRKHVSIDIVKNFLYDINFIPIYISLQEKNWPENTTADDD